MPEAPSAYSLNAKLPPQSRLRRKLFLHREPARAGLRPVDRQVRDRAETGIWQRRNWEHTIRDDADYAAHMDYIHFNPVKHGLAVTAAEWPYSSFKDCVKLAMYPPDWLGSAAEPADIGEPR
jgi:hypothetical protein